MRRDEEQKRVEKDPIYAANTQKWQQSAEHKGHWEMADSNVSEIEKVPSNKSATLGEGGIGLNPHSGGKKSLKRKIAKKTPITKKYNKKSKKNKNIKKKTITRRLFR